MAEDQSAYVAARSIEERELAANAINPAARRAHLKLAERYEAMVANQSGSADAKKLAGLYARGGREARGTKISLDMGEQSRLEGFRTYGCR